MSVRNLDFVLKPRSIALLGASPQQGTVGRVVLDNIMAGGFQGIVYPVNPKYEQIGAHRAYPSVAALPDAPDLAVIATPPDTVAPLLAELGVRGTRAAVVITAGFGEGAQAASRVRLQAVLAAARPHVMRVVGPNCFGLIAPQLGLNASFSRGMPKKGSLALISQSGAMMASIMDWATPHGIGFSVAISLGDMADVDFGDMLDWLCVDPGTSAILLYVEGITYPRKFMSAARAAARVKPVIVIKGGRHEASAKAATSHTGALAGSDAVYDAAFARAGLLRVRTMQQLFDTVALLAMTPQVMGERLAIITNGGGAGVLAVDDLLDAGGSMAQLEPATMAALDGVLPTTWSHGNPVDVIGDADVARYTAAVETVARDPNVDALLVMLCPTAIVDPLTVADALPRVLNGKPLLAAWLGEASVLTARARFIAKGTPTFSTPGGAIEGFMNLVRFRKRRATLMEVPESSTNVTRANVSAVAAIVAATASGAWLSSQDAREVLRLYGIPANPSFECATPSDAAKAAERIGRPVALKVRSPDIVHKSDVGGVILDLVGGAAVEAAAQAMLTRASAEAPKAGIDGFTIEAMVQRPQAQEVILGATIDRTFGVVIAFGRGGTAVEIIADKVLGLPPLNPNLARAMIEETQVGKLLKGYRDRPAADIDAVAQALVALSQLLIDHPAICDLDINPMLADANGIIAVDVRIKVAIPPVPGRLVISPYPVALEQILGLSSGLEVFVRPLRPDDDAVIQGLVKSLTPEDARFRFFSPLRGLGNATAARLCQLDYDREIALIAFPVTDRKTAWGVARLHADPDNERAEFAVTVASAHQGNGLGYALLVAVLEIAADRGIGEIWGMVLRDNTRMLELCGQLGFSSRPSPEDAQVVICARAPRL